MTFAEGEGTGEERWEESWVMDSNAVESHTKVHWLLESYQPGSDTYEQKIHIQKGNPGKSNPAV